MSQGRRDAVGQAVGLGLARMFAAAVDAPVGTCGMAYMHLHFLEGNV